MITKAEYKYKDLLSFLSSELDWHLARIKFFGIMICALCQIQTVNFQKLSECLASGAKISSNLRRIQRFFSGFEIDLGIISGLLFKLLPAKPPFTLTMDRTNWKFGHTHINILMLGVAYKGVAIPLMWKMLAKGGNSDSTERVELIERFIQLFGKDKIECLLADREFVGEEWFEYLLREEIHFHIRVKENFEVKIPGKGKVKARWLFNSLPLNQEYHYPRIVYLKGNLVYLSGVRIIGQQGKIEFVIIASYRFSLETLAKYKERWQIETLFKALKTSGFNVEDTHLVDLEKINRVLVLVAITFVWSYLVGIYRHENIEKIIIKKHGRKAHSFFAFGLSLLVNILFNFDYKLFTTCVKLLSCT